MAEIAEGMINGELCSTCGCFFEDPEHPGLGYIHGYPVDCKDCWEPDSANQKAEVETF